MKWLMVFVLAVGLASDAFAASITSGVTAKRIRFRDAIKTGLFFGIFQGLMPLLGWCCGNSIQSMIQAYDHWVAFLLLGFVGVKTLAQAWMPEKREPKDFPRARELLILAIATSIDAMAVGISLAMTDANIFVDAAIIGGVTCLMCTAGVLLGKRLGPAFEQKAEILGGVTLILLGVQILTEHLLGAA